MTAIIVVHLKVLKYIKYNSTGKVNEKKQSNFAVLLMEPWRV